MLPRLSRRFSESSNVIARYSAHRYQSNSNTVLSVWYRTDTTSIKKCEYAAKFAEIASASRQSLSRESDVSRREMLQNGKKLYNFASVRIPILEAMRVQMHRNVHATHVGTGRSVRLSSLARLFESMRRLQESFFA